MGVGQGRSRLDKLIFHVSNRAIHPDWMTTRAFSRVGQSDWSADIRIIEGGHVISFRHDDLVLTEVLAEHETSLPSEGILLRFAVKNDCPTKLRPWRNLEYFTSCEVEKVDDEVFRHLDQEYTLEGLKGDLFHRFASTNRLRPSPLSRVHFEPMSRGIAVHFYHTFPDEKAILRSQALFQCT